MLQNLYEGYSYVPSDAAIKYKNSIINYGRLNEHLIECSKMFSCMNCATTVLIMMDKGVEIVIATISVFLSKNVFCILDKNITEITFNEIIEETKSSVIFTDLKNSKRSIKGISMSPFLRYILSSLFSTLFFSLFFSYLIMQIISFNVLGRGNRKGMLKKLFKNKDMLCLFLFIYFTFAVLLFKENAHILRLQTYFEDGVFIMTITPLIIK